MHRRDRKDLLTTLVWAHISSDVWGNNVTTVMDEAPHRPVDRDAVMALFPEIPMEQALTRLVASIVSILLVQEDLP